MLRLKILALLLLLSLIAFILLRTKTTSGKQALQNEQAGATFLAQNKTHEGVMTTESGLQYLQLNAGHGQRHPKASDSVRVHYHGTLIDGTVFDSSVTRGQPIDFPLNRVIAGWTEGLQLMVEGEKTRLFIPPQLAYGNRRTGPIPSGSTLIFDVELLAINPE
jgi:peptidylprolyl isomerase